MSKYILGYILHMFMEANDRDTAVCATLPLYSSVQSTSIRAIWGVEIEKKRQNKMIILKFNKSH